jgi:predicted glycoside hydrolase/deacetylase ChbG (UPF0249 family)
MRQLILCADDFGYSPAISMTIVELALAGRLNAISCMAACAGWETDSAWLKGLPSTIQFGLHLVLTGEPPLTNLDMLTDSDGRLPPINTLARLARFGRLPLAAIAAEISAQFARFEIAVGRPPDFVDGHQHAHLLPGIRPIVLAETAKRAPKAWLRDCTDRPAAIAARPFKLKAIGSALHSVGLRSAARANGLECNSGFAGHYGFAGNYAEIFPKFLNQPGDRHLVMCHPGAGNLAGDDIAAARIIEARALHQLPIADIAHDHGLAFAA